MSHYTFLLILEATIEGPDAGEAADTLSSALEGQAGLLRNGTGTIVGYLHDVEPYPRWWPARPVEIEVVQRAHERKNR